MAGQQVSVIGEEGKGIPMPAAPETLRNKLRVRNCSKEFVCTEKFKQGILC